MSLLGGGFSDAYRTDQIPIGLYRQYRLHSKTIAASFNHGFFDKFRIISLENILRRVATTTTFNSKYFDH